MIFIKPEMVLPISWKWRDKLWLKKNKWKNCMHRYQDKGECHSVIKMDDWPTQRECPLETSEMKQYRSSNAKVHCKMRSLHVFNEERQRIYATWQHCVVMHQPYWEQHCHYHSSSSAGAKHQPCIVFGAKKECVSLGACKLAVVHLCLRVCASAHAPCLGLWIRA